MTRRCLRLLVLFIFLFMQMRQLVDSKVNLFITRKEMNRTLGVSAEMSYVENGSINAYSTKFPYRVSPNISHIMFTWNSMIKDRPIYYSISAVAEDFNVLPILGIPNRGIVPTKTETFSVEYRCAGSRAGQFMVTLHFNITYPSETNTTEFTLKQEKICASKDGRRALAGNLENEYTPMDVSNSSMNIEYIIYIAIASLLLIVAISLIAVCVYSRTNRKGGMARFGGGRNVRSTPTSYPTKDTSVFDSPSQPFLQPNTSTPVSKGSSPRLPVVFEDLASTSKEPKIIFERKQNADINHVLVELYADRNLFQTLPFVELEGTFGEIRWAVWRQTGIGLSGDIDDEEDDVNEEIAVICKTLKHTSDRSHFEKFIREALVFHNVPQHLNLAQICAAATYGHFNTPESIKDFPLLAYRHTGFGILKKFLHTCRGISGINGASEAGSSHSRGGPGHGAANQTLRTHDLVSMSQQALKAIIHLHRFGVIHKDVATRNCLVAEIPALGLSDRLHIQLCDAALSRDIFPADYHTPAEAEDNTSSRPIKWMGPEALRSNVFNSASDVWSYGVFMWELFTCGQQPYLEIPFEEMPTALAAGTRLGQPYNCPDELYSIMYSCWNQEVLERPQSLQLQKAIEDFAQQLRKYI